MIKCHSNPCPANLATLPKKIAHLSTSTLPIITNIATFKVTWDQIDVQIEDVRLLEAFQLSGLKTKVAHIVLGSRLARVHCSGMQKSSFVSISLQSIISNCGIALQDWQGDREMNELSFPYGALVTNIKHKTEEWSLGDHRGDKQKYFKRNSVRLLTKDELAYVNSLVGLYSLEKCVFVVFVKNSNTATL